MMLSLASQNLFTNGIVGSFMLWWLLIRSNRRKDILPSIAIIIRSPLGVIAFGPHAGHEKSG
ncbi:hypothetical protein BDC45DRAFT_510215 [Circinella umbellata]|nr:hypothetical protein BDC45DRAFT_510215 [Circinella umbellata]